jgi:predicted ATP-dependent endonuclease of OLD family
MRLAEIRISNMWSYGQKGAVLDGLGQQNVIIGKNNSGKSRILEAIRLLQSPSFQASSAFSLSGNQEHDDGSGAPAGPARLEFKIELEGVERQTIANTLLNSNLNDFLLAAASEFISAAFRVGAKREKLTDPMLAFFETTNSDFNIENHLRGRDVSAGRQQWSDRYLSSIRASIVGNISGQMRYVGGWRTLKQPLQGGMTIIQLLHQWKNPEPNNKLLRRDFIKVQDIFRELMLCPRIELCPEHNGQSLSIDMNGKYLSIDSLGDGVQHLLMIAFHLATIQQNLLLVEEPETHLHPELQRNLMRIMRRDLRGQAFITTHSPVLLDSASPDTRFYRVEHDEKASTAYGCHTSRDLHRVLNLLDVRASDILQANVVVWVEGPTDRMFLKKCFQLRGERFVEGVHYQIAHYGGALRSYCTFSELPELVDLLKLSRHVVMVCDSDKENESDPIDDTKERLRVECEKAGGIYWITDGREIENYLPDEVLTETYQDLLQGADVKICLSKFGKISKTLAQNLPTPKHGDGWKVNYEDNKVRLMEEFLKRMKLEHLSQWGLNNRLGQIVNYIKSASPDA